MAVRLRFLNWVAEQIGAAVLWAGKGEGPPWDCSGFVARGLRKVGGPDLTQSHNTDAMWRDFEPVEEENVQPGDLVFWWAPDATPEQVANGADPRPASERGDVEHVAVMAAGGKVISADGATHRITSLAEAKAAGARVRVHDDVHRMRPRLAGFRKFPLIDTPNGPALACGPRGGGP